MIRSHRDARLRVRGRVLHAGPGERERPAGRGQLLARSQKRAKDIRKALGDPGDRRRISKPLIAREDIDLYIIALPNEEHLPVSLALSNAKRNQVCTKPLARNRNEAKQMLAAARRSGAMHGYAETEVFAPPW